MIERKKSTEHNHYFTRRECLYLAFFPFLRRGESIPIPHTQIDNPISYLGTDLSAMNQRVFSHYNLFDETVNRYLLKELKLYCANGICPEDEVKWLFSATPFELLFIDNDVTQGFNLFLGSQTQPIAFSIGTASYLCQSGYPPLSIHWSEEYLATRIVLLIDLCLSGTVEGKITLLNNLKQKAQTAKGKISGTLRLKDGIQEELLSEFTSWICNYQNKFYTEKYQIQNLLIIQPETDKYALDKMLANCMIKAMAMPSLYDLFELKVKGAWSQKKHKIKNVKKVARNYSFDKDTIEMLNELAKHRGRSKTETLESLINEAHTEYRINVKKPNRS